MALKTNRKAYNNMYKSGIMPKLERKELNIDWLKSTYESGYVKLFPVAELGYAVNKKTGDWFMGVQRGMLDPIKTGLFYYNKTLFEVKIKHPDRSIYQNDPLVYMMEIVSVIPFKDKKNWTREGYVEEETIEVGSKYLTSQLLDTDSISKFDIESMEKIIKDFYIEVMWRTIEKKPKEFCSVTIGFKGEK